MSPSPLTLIGIIPGHWIMGAEFTATSMIGMIALGGIIVRQSILIVEFVKIEVAKGKDVREAAIRGAEIRMRPIFITSLTTMAGASTILSDPIFSGLAISTLFGAGVGTCMALLVIPLGCISARKQFYMQTADDGTVGISPAYQKIEKVGQETSAKPAGTPLWMRLYSGIISVFTWFFYIIRAVFTMLGMGFKAILSGFGRRRGTTPPPPPPTPGGGTPPPPPPHGGTPPPPREAPPTPQPAPAAETAAAATTEPAVSAVAAQPPVDSASRMSEAPAPAPAPASEPALPGSMGEEASVVQSAVADDADHSGEGHDESATSATGGEDEGESEGIVRKRRGIRLKQDLN
jgi:hypothetical protein